MYCKRIHQHDIGNLPQNSTRRSREVIRTLVVYLRLADIGQENFDRRLGGENIIRELGVVQKRAGEAPKHPQLLNA
jgi:hypothetical protein